MITEFCLQKKVLQLKTSQRKEGVTSIKGVLKIFKKFLSIYMPYVENSQDMDPIVHLSGYPDFDPKCTKIRKCIQS